MENGITAPAAANQAPALIAGRYVVGESFASGGTGTVHLGRIVGAGGFSRVVAVKRLFPAVAGDRGFREMLLAEARLVSRIRHPNVVPALDVVQVNDDVYIVMEYVHRPSLAQLLARARASGEPIPGDIASGIIEAVLLGLHAAHEARGEEGTPLGIVHRDVSPQNILVGADGVTRLIDFGIAKAATGIQITDPGILKGKMGYMAPEQFLYQPVSRHSDVYASSVVLWEALANQRLFEGRSKQLNQDPGDRSVRHAMETKVLPPSHVRSGIDAFHVVRRAEFEPNDRFPTAEAMAVALRSAHAVASPVDIARWLSRVAPDDLEMAEERVRLLEQAPYVASTDGGVTPTTHADWSLETINPEHPRGGRRARWIGMGAIALATAVLALVIGAKTVRRPRRPPPRHPSSIRSPRRSIPVVTPPPALEHPALRSATAARQDAPVPESAYRKTSVDRDPSVYDHGTGHKHYHPAASDEHSVPTTDVHRRRLALLGIVAGWSFCTPLDVVAADKTSLPASSLTRAGARER
jgi:serine/threonine-protein kinase